MIETNERYLSADGWKTLYILESIEELKIAKAGERFKIDDATEVNVIKIHRGEK